MQQSEDKEEDQTPISELVSTQFFEWSCRHFLEPSMCLKKEQDSESQTYHQREYRFLRNARVRSLGRDQIRAGKILSVIYFYVVVLI